VTDNPCTVPYTGWDDADNRSPIMRGWSRKAAASEG
jgi:hypothetical protein